MFSSKGILSSIIRCPFNVSRTHFKFAFQLYQFTRCLFCLSGNRKCENSRPISVASNKYIFTSIPRYIYPLRFFFFFLCIWITPRLGPEFQCKAHPILCDLRRCFPSRHTIREDTSKMKVSFCIFLCFTLFFLWHFWTVIELFPNPYLYIVWSLTFYWSIILYLKILISVNTASS